MYVEYFQYFNPPDEYGYLNIEAVRLQPSVPPVEQHIKYLEIPKYDTGYAYLIAGSIEHDENGTVDKNDFILEFTDSWDSAYIKLNQFVNDRQSLLKDTDSDWYRLNIYKFSNDNNGILYTNFIEGVKQFNRDLMYSNWPLHKIMIKYADWYNYHYDYINGKIISNTKYSGYMFCGSDTFPYDNCRDWIDWHTKRLIDDGKLKSPLG